VRIAAKVAAYPLAVTAAMKLPLALLLFLPLTAWADACTGVDTALSDADKAGLAPAVGRQLEVRGVKLLQSWRSGDWRVLHIAARDADDSYVFYAGDPLSQRFADAIGGFALPEGEAATRQWIVENIKGIPVGLAACVAQAAARGN
jgi:hypothetical protein